MVYIILCMIVKNEARILERCIQSAAPIIDAISICDTGSTDNTVDVIKKWAGILKGDLHQHVWKNFGHNRSLSFNACVETAKKLGFPLDQTYALHLDADMCLVPKPDFKKHELGKNREDGYLIPQIAGSLFYYNTRLSRLSKPWKCISVTHEYWACDGGNIGHKLDTLTIDDRNDGGCKSDKYERDIKLLTQGLIDEPKNERYMYYLAQSYKDSGNPRKAIEVFKKRIDAKGWEEEMWYAMLQIARCYTMLNEEDNVVLWYLKAYETRPTRAESLYELSNFYRVRGKNQLAFMFARQASEIPFSQDLLFINQNCYNFECDTEMSITGFYTPLYKAKGFESSNKLSIMKNIPPELRNMVINNILYYLPKISPVYKDISIELPPNYSSCNPCLSVKNKKMFGCVRTVNYNQHKGDYKPRDSDGKVRTRNFMTEFNADFKAISQYEIVDNFSRQKHEGHVLGLEDVRIFSYKGEWWFSCTSLMEKQDHLPCICLGKLSFNQATKTYDVVHFVPLRGAFVKPIEKNWTPFVNDGNILFVYGTEPFTIVKANPMTGVCTIVSQKSTEFNLSNFRGGSPPIRYNDDEWIYVIHEVAFVDWRTYTHRLVKFNDKFEITGITKPFIFDHKGVEFCISLVQKDNIFYFGVGIEDAVARTYMIQDKDLTKAF